MLGTEQRSQRCEEGRYPLCEGVQFVVHVRCDAIVFGYQGDSRARLLAGQPEAVTQGGRQCSVLLPPSYLCQTGGWTK